MSQFAFDGNSNKVDLGLACYPVGSIYMSLNPTDPSQLFGGTWQPLDEGRVLIGANSTYPVNSTGGEATHTLTIDEMPQHTHGLINLDNESGWVLGALDRQTNGTQYTGGLSGGNLWNDMYWSLSENYITFTGNNQPHNNMQPYLAVYMWYRTA